MAKDAREKGQLDTGMIKDLAELLVSTGLSEIEVEMEREGLKVRVARQVTALPAAAALVAAPVAAAPARASEVRAAEPVAEGRPAADPASHPGAVKSPMVGTAYVAPEPGAPPFIEIGTRVAQGQTVLIIEAMKTMNHIPAPRAGTVTQILVGNGQPVEYGEPLLIIE